MTPGPGPSPRASVRGPSARRPRSPSRRTAHRPRSPATFPPRRSPRTSRLPADAFFEESGVSFASVWLKLENTTPDDLPPEGLEPFLRDAARATPLAMSSCAQPGCTLVKFDFVLRAQDAKRAIEPVFAHPTPAVLVLESFFGGGIGVRVRRPAVPRQRRRVRRRLRAPGRGRGDARRAPARAQPPGRRPGRRVRRGGGRARVRPRRAGRVGPLQSRALFRRSGASALFRRTRRSARLVPVRAAREGPRRIRLVRGPRARVRLPRGRRRDTRAAEPSRPGSRRRRSPTDAARPRSREPR